MSYKKSEVVFNEKEHTYTRRGEQLSGITRLIHAVLHLGSYDGLNEYVKQVKLPAAAHYGKCVHKAIQDYELTGIAMTLFGEEQHETSDYGVTFFPEINVNNELEAYKSVKPDGWNVDECEFLVDYGDFASSIDAVWSRQEKIALVDYKTTNLDYYEGGADALKEYLSWQLSCYALMFEAQTGCAVDQLYGIHIRDGKAELWEIERKDKKAVEQLLNGTDVSYIGGQWLFANKHFENFLPAYKTNSLVVPSDVINAISALLYAEEKAKQMKEKLRELMAINGVKKWECDAFTASLTKESVVNTIDSTRLKEEQPDIYNEYLKQTVRKAWLRITKN